MSSEKISGIYCIENKITDKKYVGKSINIQKRWNRHIICLNQNRHQNKYLQNSWNKYGIAEFNFYILEQCENSLLSRRERFWIQKLNTFNTGFNLTMGGEGNLNRKVSKETRIKLSIKNTGRKHTKEEKLKMSLSHLGKINTECGAFGKKNKNATSKYFGVCFFKATGQWESQLNILKKKESI